MSLQDVLKAVQDSYEFKKTATVKGVTYGLRVLNVDQEKTVNAAVSVIDEEDPTAYVKELRKEILSRSIVEIKGERIPDIVETPDGKKDKSIFLKEFLGTLPDVLIEKLFDVYVDLREEAQKAIEDEMQYDWFKTPEQRQKEYEDAEEEKEAEEKRSADNSEDLNKSEKAAEDEIEDVDLKPVTETEEPEIPPVANK